MLKNMTATTAIGTWILLVMSGNAVAGADSTYLQDANGCRLYDSTPRANETVMWTGGCKDGFADGSGKVTWIVDGKVTSTSEGTFRYGKPNGHAVIHYSGGEVYDGELVDGILQGHGIMTAADGTVREGEFDHGALPMNPAMKLWFANFSDRINEALGQAAKPPGTGTVVIVADIDAAKKVTTWRVKSSSGSNEIDTYVVDGANRVTAMAPFPTVTKTLTYTYKYANDVVATAPEKPPATITFVTDANGCQAENPQPSPGKTITWTGACKDGFVDGQGILTWPDARGGATTIEAVFVHGQAQSPVVMTFPDKRRYEGQLTHNSVTGVGTLSDVSGNHYVGDLVEGRFQGQGRITYADHATYAGGWYGDMRFGAGDFVDSDGSHFQGNYLNNARIGYGILDATGRIRYAGRFMKDRPADEVSYASRTTGPGFSDVEYEPLNLPVEAYKTYRQLTPAEKAKVDAQYQNLSPGDEPPYPMRGLLPIYHELLRLESLALLSGTVSILVHVDATGHAAKVDVLDSPDDDMSTQFTAFVMHQPFKPALCAHAACANTFPLAVRLSH